MANILKVVEVLSESPDSWEDAAKKAVSKTAASIRHIKSIYIKEMEAQVDNDKITSYRINAKISFLVD